MTEDPRVVRMHDGILLGGEADPIVVEALERLLNEARNGVITDIAFVAVRRDRNARSGHVGRLVPTTQMLGWLQRLQYRLTKEAEEQE